MINIREVATARRWMVPNASARGGEIEIAGWDFGGDGPLLLAHHANGICAAPWALVAQQLRRNFRVVAIDARGHGDSAHLQVPQDYEWRYFSDDLTHVARQLLAETGTEKVALGLGSSFGGIVTAAAEAASPGLFERIIMLDPPIHPRADLVAELGLDMVAEPDARRADLVGQTLRRRAVWDSRQQAWDAWRGKQLFAPWRDEAFALYLAEGLADQADGSVVLKCPPAVEAHIFATTGSLGPLDYAPLVDCPVLLVHAQRGFFPLEFFRHIAGLFRRGELVQMVGGHMLPLEVPDLVVGLVRDWMDVSSD